MAANRTKEGGAPAAVGYTCETCGSKFPTPEALVVHLGSSHPRYGKPASQPEDALSFAPGGTVADSDAGPRPGGKMDRETSRPAKRWEAPGEQGDPRKGLRNEGVPPIEIPGTSTESGHAKDHGTPGTQPDSASRERRKKSTGGG
jgi:hypothetical protein